MSQQSSDTWGPAGHLGLGGNSGLPLPDCPASSPGRSAKAFLLIPHGSVYKTVATVPNLKAIKLPRPQEAVPGWPRPPLLHHLRLQCTCISGWPGLNGPQGEGRDRMRLGIHTMPERWVPARVCLRETTSLCIHRPRPNPYQLSEQKL